MVVISLHALHISFFHPNCAQTGHGDGSKVQGTEGFDFYFFDAPYANSTLEALMSIFLLCCTRLFHGVCFHSCLSDNLTYSIALRPNLLASRLSLVPKTDD
ncbi:hypothetical protein SLA2020_381090 [Shorea laevis]